jgi:hypothetical protein
VKRKSYLFDLGDSNDGPIGMVLRVLATNQNQAVQIARKALRLAIGECGQITVQVPDQFKDDVEYIALYVNPDNVTKRDISEEETEAT